MTDMTDTTDFDRLLTSWLETSGPADVDATTVEFAVASSRRQGQRRGLLAALVGPAPWPPMSGRWSRAFGGRTVVRFALVVLLLAAAAAVAVVGSRWLLLRVPTPHVVQGILTPAGTLSTNRDSPVAVALPDGRIVVGGYASLDGTLAEIVDVAAGRSRSVASEAPGSSLEAAALLPDGRVLLIVWTWDGTGSASNGRSTGRILDPATGSLTPTGPMEDTRFEASVATLTDGRILVAGGIPSQEPTHALASAEIFDPATGTFRATGSLVHERAGHAMTTLEDGRVLVTGGYRLEGGGPTAPGPESKDARTAELYDPATGHFTEVPSPTGRVGAAHPVRLTDGRILVFGVQDGQYCGRHGIDPTAALFFDPATMAFAPAPQLPHTIRTATVLPDSRVLVTGSWSALAPPPGGCTSGGTTYVDDAWLGIYDPASGITLESRDPFSGRSTLAADTDHAYGAATALDDGSVVLVADGISPDSPVPPSNAIDIFR